ncbi:PP2C family protein-serine/threonine phosphatase, partial [Virgisporangium aurantiacum]|uniref:PP2C family protein-serine/threonine phosphatase n=1 Tax=Virgisporangium aurantiacum TaxID=175570 RepID=UPI0019515505
MADPLRAFRDLVAGSHQARPEDVPALAMRCAELLDAREMVIYLVDYEQRNLMPLTGDGTPHRTAIAVDGTLPGRSFAMTETHETNIGSGLRLWVPLLDGIERLGVLEVITTRKPSRDLLADYRTAAGLLSEVLMTRRAYGDAVERIRRRLPMQLAAEIIWNLLPPLTFATPDVLISAILEPAYDVGGDAFDYAVNGGVLHAAVFDAVGHGIDASAMTSLTISAYRNARRCGLDLADTYRSIDKWVSAKYPHGFVTAALTELDTDRGQFRRISAGHPGELLFRDGKLVRTLTAPTAMPLGLGHLGTDIPTVEEETLQPGDQLLLYTDGVTEARTDTREFFGPERLIEFVTRSLADHVSAPETLRRLVHAILEHQHENLQDDATAVLIEWQPALATTRDMLPETAAREVGRPPSSLGGGTT